MRVALTQQPGRLGGLAAGLAARGLEVVHIPLIRTEMLVSDTTRRRARALLDCPWLLLTSSSAVEAWTTLQLPLRGIRPKIGPKIGVVGERTAQAVKAAGGVVTLIAEPQNARGLAEALLQHPEVASPVGLPCGDKALSVLSERLEQHGIEVRKVVVYRTLECIWQADQVDVVVLASPSAVQALPVRVAESAMLVTLGPSTRAAVMARGWRCLEAERPDASALLEVLEKVRERVIER